MIDIDAPLLRRLDLNNLVALHTLLDTRSVSRSAAVLCLGQPAVSHLLKRLRVQLDDELLCRYGREMRLTPLAESLRAPLAQWLEQGQQLFLRPRPFAPESVEAVYRLAMPDLLEAVLLPDLISRLARQAPGLSLQVLAMPGQEAQSAMEQERIDSAIGYFPEPSPRLMRQALFQNGFVCLYNPHLLSLPDPLSILDLARAPHVLTSYASDSVSLIDSQLRAHGLSRRVIASCASLLAIPAILEQVAAIAILPDSIARVIQRHDHPLRLQPIAHQTLSIQIEQLWHPRLNGDPLHAWMRRQILAVARAEPLAS